MRIVTWMLVSGGLLLGGCAATVQRGAGDGAALSVPAQAAQQVVLNVTGSPTATQSADWEQFKGEWRAAMKSAAAAAGIGYAAQDGKPVPTGNPGTLLVVHVNDYRYVSSGARLGLGVMTGNAFVDARVQFLDLNSGARFGERSYNTSSSAWQGVFAPMTSKQIEAICKEIVAQIKPR